MARPCTLAIKNNTLNVLRVEWIPRLPNSFPNGIGGGTSVLKPSMENFMETGIIENENQGDTRYTPFDLKLYEYNFKFPIEYKQSFLSGDFEPAVYLEKPITEIGEVSPSFVFRGSGDNDCYKILVTISLVGRQYKYLIEDPEADHGEVYTEGTLRETSPDGLYTTYVPYPG
ncbi:hypothetical protein IAQ67_15100 [Paenibacillus peoriae]|uniref:Uncharacterized protein n=1 Tax=Paenibacillus peoriae TaxID=59893 RepID=A0A7H0Y2D3_9BACL|nr:hypothetical protein [Paenibacillus peoriae]QNR65241.1 hypothetical protein IAQ67_15100 [Paenibacillus peoriae]